MGWHRCDRFWKVGFDCPFRELVEHEEKRDEEDDPDDEAPSPPMLPERVPRPVRPVPREVPVVIPARRREPPEPPATQDIIAVAEGIVRDVPDPWRAPEPVRLPEPAPPWGAPAPPVRPPVRVPVGEPVADPDEGYGVPGLRPVFGGFTRTNLAESLVSATIAAGVGAAMGLVIPLFAVVRAAPLPNVFKGIGIEAEKAFVEGVVARYMGKAALILGAARFLGIRSSNRPAEVEVKADFPFHRGHFINFTEYLDTELRRPELQGSGDGPKKAIYQSPKDAITLDEDFT